MIRTALWYAHFTLSLIKTLPEFSKKKKLKDKISKDDFLKQVNAYISVWALSQIKLSGANIILDGVSNIPKRNVLFVSNHQSNFDIAIFLALIPKDKSFIAKTELKKIPILRDWMELLGCIFIDRKDIRSQGKAIIDGINLLKEGKSLVIFPEGTRSKSDNMQDFKSTSLKLATKANVPIVPVSISGSYKLMEANNNFIKPAKVFVTIHKPIETSSFNNKNIDLLNLQVTDIIRSALKNN